MIDHPLTEVALQRAARVLAEACNGGRWETHYTETQREVWRERVRKALQTTENANG